MGKDTLVSCSGACYPLVPCSYRVSTIKMHTHNIISLTQKPLFIIQALTTWSKILFLSIFLKFAIVFSCIETLAQT